MAGTTGGNKIKGKVRREGVGARLMRRSNRKEQVGRD
jgi:hypothetical protein